MGIRGQEKKKKQFDVGKGAKKPQQQQQQQHTHPPQRPVHGLAGPPSKKKKEKEKDKYGFRSGTLPPEYYDEEKQDKYMSK